MEKSFEEQSLENAALLYMDANAWAAAIGIFATLARLNPQNPNGWFGIGSALWRMSVENPDLLDLAIGPLKRAVELNPNPDNRNYKHLLRSATESAAKAGIDPESIPAYNGDPMTFAEAVKFEPEMLIAPARNLNWEGRARLVMSAEEVKGDLFLALLEDLAANDPNSNVKRSAQRAIAKRPAKTISTTEMQAAATRLSSETTPSDDDEDTAADTTAKEEEG